MPGESKHILSTRPLETALLDQVRAAGMLLDTRSFIETRAVMDPALTSQVRSLALRPLVAVFTSVNAVEAVAGHLQRTIPGDTGRHIFSGVQWEIFCIGYATGQAVRQVFGDDCIAGTADSADILANGIIQWFAGTNTDAKNADAEGTAASGSPAGGRAVYFFCGDQRRDDLPRKLRESSIRVNELIVYTTIPVPQKIEREYDGIVFFSPSAVQSFFSINTVSAETVLFAIGQTTANALREQAGNQIIVSTTPDKEALIRKVIDHFTPLTP